MPALTATLFLSPLRYCLNLTEGLEQVLAQGLVKKHPCPEGFSIYSLADNAEKRQTVLELAGLDLGQAQVLARLVLRPGVA